MSEFNSRPVKIETVELIYATHPRKVRCAVRASADFLKGVSRIQFYAVIQTLLGIIDLRSSDDENMEAEIEGGHVTWLNTTE